LSGGAAGGLSAEARAVHDAALIVDLHCDLLLTRAFFGWDFQKRHRPNPLPGAALFGHCDVPRLREGNVGAIAFGVVTNPLRRASGPKAVESDLDALAAEVARAPDTLALCGSAQAIRAARAAGKIACFAGLEGAHGLIGRLDDLPRFREKGLRYVGLVHFTRNEAARPMVGWGASNRAGLTDYGRDLVDELGRLGVLVDCAHLGKAAVLETAARVRGRRPVLVSHTGCNAVFGSPRGVDDEVLRAVADTDGVVGVIFVSMFIGRGGAETAARHLDHIKRTVGIRHCALGTDWEGFALYPSDLDSAEKLPNLTAALLRLGWTAEEVHAAYGGNVLRVIEAGCGG
jgi:membrane dipeptidase